MRSSVMEWRGILFFLMGGGMRGVFFQVVFVVESGLSTVQFPLGQWTFDFPCKLFFWVGRGEKQRVPMFPKKFPIVPHFYPICFGRCCPPFISTEGERGRLLYFTTEPSTLGSLQWVFFWGMDQSNRLITVKKNWTLEAPHVLNRRGE
jgi:hypothetical protein